MIRTLTLAALAAAVLAAPASAQSEENQSIRISTVGKTPAQVQAEVQKAARQLCSRATWNASFPIEESRACVARTVRNTYARAVLAAATEVAAR